MESRFGIHLAGIGIESIEFTPESRELVKQYSSNRMNVTAYENISQQASNIAAQQKRSHKACKTTGSATWAA